MNEFIATDVRRFLGYGWKNRIIIRIIRYKYEVNLTKQMIQQFR